METKTYHHGDLRHALIETGIELISQEGEDKLSLRKVAAKCGVSNAAPYAHFKNKDEFINAIQQHIMDLFTQTLESAAKKYAKDPFLLTKLGKEYVLFFYKNPLYYDFLFSRKNIQIRLSLDTSEKSNNPPLDMFKKIAINVFRSINIPEKIIQDKIIAMWALVHGLSAIVIMPNVEYGQEWESRIENIIRSISYRNEKGE